MNSCSSYSVCFVCDRTLCACVCVNCTGHRRRNLDAGEIWSLVAQTMCWSINKVLYCIVLRCGDWVLERGDTEEGVGRVGGGGCGRRGRNQVVRFASSVFDSVILGNRDI